MLYSCIHMETVGILLCGFIMLYSELLIIAVNYREMQTILTFSVTVSS